MAAATPDTDQYAGAIVAPAFAFGLNTSTPAGAVHHLDGQRLLWPAGRFFATLSAEDGKASFIAMAASARGVTALQLSPNRRYLAAAEQVGEGEAPSVSVYNVLAAAEKREHSLGLTEHTASLSVSALSFSGDGKLLLVASCGPDWVVMLWRWQQSKVLQVVSAKAPLCCACLSPWDEGVMAVAGLHIVRGYRLDLKAAAPPPKHSNWLMLDSHGGSRITCMVHLVGGMLAVGTDAGQVLVCGPAGLITSFDIATQHASAACIGVQALVQRGRGFVAAGSQGDVLLFEPPGASSAGSRSGKEADVFSLSRRFIFAEASSSSCSNSAKQQPDTPSNAAGASSQFVHLPPELRVIGFSVSATDDHLALATAAGKLQLLNLTAAAEAEDEAAAASALGGDMAAAEPAAAQGGIPASARRSSEAGGADDEEQQGPAQWASVCGGFAGRVVGLDAATHLPLLLAASKDGWVRVWDWMRRQQLAARQLEGEQPLCCALHPSGLLAAVGTAEVLRVFWVLRGVLSPVAELPVARCSLARYSHGGGLLAAVGRNNAITLFPSFYGDGPACSSPAASSSNKAASSRHGAAQHASGARSHLRSTGVLAPAAVLKGHVSSVTDMVFTRDDQRLITSGAGGALFTWDVATGSRLVQLDHVDKKLVFLQRPLFSRPHTTAPILCHSPSLLR